MGTCTLDWHADRGFELELDLTDGELSIRLATVPVNADGTAELERGVDLDRLDILFKASVELQGETAQLLDARIVLLRDGRQSLLQIDARCEDVETGSVIPFQGRVPVRLPSGVPVAGGPRPVPTNEDELDWDDETTLEQLVVKAPETSGRHKAAHRDDDGDGRSDDDDADDEPPPPAGKARGLQALLEALAQIDDDTDDEDDEPSLPTPRPPAAPRATPAKSSPAPKPPPSASSRLVAAEREEGDQSLGAKGEARALLDLLVSGDNLEVEDDADLDELAAGVAKILALPGSSEGKAARLSEWLLQQDGVADLFIGDDDLAELLERW